MKSVLAVALAVGAWAFEPWRLFTSSELTEAAPSSTPSSTPSSSPSSSPSAPVESPADGSTSPEPPPADHNYGIPVSARIAGMRSVVIGCDRFNVAFGSAPVELA